MRLMLILKKSIGPQMLVFFCFFLSSFLLSAQPTFNYAEIKAKYPLENIYILSQMEHLVIKAVGDSLLMQSEKTTVTLFLSDKAPQFSEKAITYSDHFSAIRDIEAKTWVPGKRHMKSVKVKNINTRKPVAGGVFYDDYMEKYFNFQGLQPGAVSSLTYTEDVFDPHFPGSFYFGFYAPVEHAEYQVTFTDNVKINYLLNDSKGVVKFSETHRKGTTTYTFTSENVPGIQYEGDSPDISYYAPHIVVYVKSYITNGREVKVLDDLSCLYKWYRGMMATMNPERTPVMKALVDSITKDKNTREEKIKAVFYWLQDNIKYIAFEDGLGGFIPRNPKDIFEKRFGDCKDKAVLLNALLAEAGIASSPVWIGTRDIPYSYTELPSPIVDNHMIAAIQENGRWIFLDGTSMHLSYGLPTSMIQGKEALIGISSDSFAVVKVPEISMEKNVVKDNFTINIDKNNVFGRGTSSITGYGQQIAVVNLEQLSAQKRIEYLQKNQSFGNNKYSVKDFILNGMEYRDSALTYAFNYSMADYVNEVDGDLYINLQLRKPLLNDKLDVVTRKTDREVEYKYIDKLQTTLVIPTGYVASKLPADRSFENPDFGFSVKYEKTNNAIVMNREIHVNTLLVKMSRFGAWNEMIDKLDQCYKELVLINKL